MMLIKKYKNWWGQYQVLIKNFKMFKLNLMIENYYGLMSKSLLNWNKTGRHQT